MTVGDRTLTTALAVGAAALIGACGAGGSSRAGGSSGAGARRATATRPTPGGTASAERQITRDWVEFFNPKTPTSRRVELLQDGTAFRQVIASQSQSPLAQQTNAHVSAVSLSGRKQATVNYTILLDGRPALRSQKGIAVDAGGVWKVSDRSFCGLLSLQGSAPSSCPKG